MANNLSTRRLIALLAQHMRNLAIDEAPVSDRGKAPNPGHKGGQLRDSIKDHIISDTEAIVGPHVPYARAVHDGRPPMTIRPRGKKALYWKGAAHPVKSVRHPGIKPNPYLARAAARFVSEPLPPLIRQTLGEDVAQALEADVKRLGLDVKRS